MLAMVSLRKVEISINVGVDKRTNDQCEDKSPNWHLRRPDFDGDDTENEADDCNKNDEHLFPNYRGHGKTYGR